MQHEWIALMAADTSAHEWMDIAFSLIGSALAFLIKRFVGKFDRLQERTAKNETEIRITRAAVARVEERVGLSPFPYAEIR